MRPRFKPAISFIGRLYRSTDASYSILAAILSVVIVGFTGLAVDLVAIMYAQKQLQSATDLAAMAATFDFNRTESIAELALQANGPSSATLDETYIGNYVDDPSLPSADRFVASTPNNAVRLVTRSDVPVHFMRMLTGAPTVPVEASAIAYNLPLAGLAIGTGFADSDNAQTNAYEAAITGNPYNLTQAERDALEATRISVFRFLDQLAVAGGSQNNAMESVLATDVDLPTLATTAAVALSAQAPAPTPTQATAIAALTRIAQSGSNAPPVTVSEFVTLYAHQKRVAKDMISTTTDSLGVPALSLLLGYLQMSRQDTLINLNETIPIAGLATITVEGVISKSGIGGGAPAIAVLGPAGSSATSSQGRVRLTITALQPIQINLGIINLTLTPTIPIIADIGYGGATIAGVSCGTDISASTDVAVSAQSGALQLYIGNVNNGQLNDLTMPLAPTPAEVINTPLVSVTADSQSTIAQSNTETVHFTLADINQGTVKTVDGSKTLASALTDLNNSLAVTVGSAPIGTGVLISNLLNAQVATLLAALEPELQSILASLGLRAGYIELRATAARCGIPALAM